MSNPNQICVFCGQRPANKTKEHVIPKWLISLTGDIKRLAWIGPLFETGHEKGMKIPFDQFHFPSCDTCNHAYSDLENKTASAFQRVLTCQSVSAEEWETLLNWFDKVRVGLWLGYHHYLGKNQLDITPHYRISGRVGLTDRLLAIYRTSFAGNRVNFPGIQTAVFALMPTCFTLVVNNFCFLNVSTDFLVANRIGFPHPSKVTILENGALLAEGIGKAAQPQIRRPILKYPYDRRCTVVAQAIYSRFVNEMTSDLYTTEYVTSLSAGVGRSKIVVENDSRTLVKPLFLGADWVPNTVKHSEAFTLSLLAQTLRIQNEQALRVRVDRNASKDFRESVKSNYRMARKINQVYIDLIMKRPEAISLR